MNNKSTLAEIDRLEGIAQAYARRRPIVPMTGVLEDIGDARILADVIGEYQAHADSAEEAVTEAEENLDGARADLMLAWAEQAFAQKELDALMASLSARLER